MNLSLGFTSVILRNKEEGISSKSSSRNKKSSYIAFTISVRDNVGSRYGCFPFFSSLYIIIPILHISTAVSCYYYLINSGAI